MSIKIEDEVTTPSSTGAVAFDGSPVTTQLVADNRSTDAVEYVAPGTTEVTYPAEAVVASGGSDEPVVTSVSWLSDVQTKPVAAPETPEPKQAPKRAHTKRAPKPNTKAAADTAAAE